MKPRVPSNSPFCHRVESWRCGIAIRSYALLSRLLREFRATSNAWRGHVLDKCSQTQLSASRKPYAGHGIVAG
jgi:hypothetical protein